MVSKDVLSTYEKTIVDILKHFNRYNEFFRFIFIASFLYGILLTSGLVYDLYKLGSIDAIMNYMSIPKYQHLSYVIITLLVLSLVSRRIHVFLLKKQMNKYKELYLQLFISNFKKVFVSSKKDILEKLQKEDRKKVIVSSLNNQLNHIRFVIKYYDDLNQ